MYSYSLHTIFVYQFLSAFFVAVFLFLPIFHFCVFYFCQFFILCDFTLFTAYFFHICVVIHKKLAKYTAYTKEYSYIKSCITIRSILKIHCIQANFIYQFLVHFCYINRVFLPIFQFTVFRIDQFFSIFTFL